MCNFAQVNNNKLWKTLIINVIQLNFKLRKTEIDYWQLFTPQHILKKDINNYVSLFVLYLL